MWFVSELTSNQYSVVWTIRKAKGLNCVFWEMFRNSKQIGMDLSLASSKIRCDNYDGFDVIRHTQWKVTEISNGKNAVITFNPWNKKWTCCIKVNNYTELTQHIDRLKDAKIWVRTHLPSCSKRSQ